MVLQAHCLSSSPLLRCWPLGKALGSWRSYFFYCLRTDCFYYLEHWGQQVHWDYHCSPPHWFLPHHYYYCLYLLYLFDYCHHLATCKNVAFKSYEFIFSMVHTVFYLCVCVHQHQGNTCMPPAEQKSHILYRIILIY